MTFDINRALGRRGVWLFDAKLYPRPSVILLLAVIILLWALAILAASIHDNTLHLPSPGRGLVDHYGFQATFVVAPLMLVTCYYAVSHFLRLLKKLDNILVENADAATVHAIIKPHLDSLFLRGDWKYGLLLLMIIGMAGSIWIFRKLDAPDHFWGNDVFNATAYSYSFIAANSYLLVVWSLVCPIVIFYVIHVSASAEIIVARLRKRGLFRLTF